MADITREQVVDYLSNLPVIQIAEMIKDLENKWGVKAAPAAVAVAAAADLAAAQLAAAALQEATDVLRVRARLDGAYPATAPASSYQA